MNMQDQKFRQIDNEGCNTDCGAIPNMMAESSNDMTPKKKDTFSRVRTTLADCQDSTNRVIRFET
jgi:hypothetical protein